MNGTSCDDDDGDDDDDEDISQEVSFTDLWSAEGRVPLRQPTSCPGPGAVTTAEKTSFTTLLFRNLDSVFYR